MPPPSPHNTLGIDYLAEAARLGSPRGVDLAASGPNSAPSGIIDAHTHIHGAAASRIYDRARRAFGVSMTYSMTQLPLAAAVRDVLGDSIRFMAIPTWSDPEKDHAHGRNYLRAIESFHRDFGARVMKLWASPRLRDIVPSMAGEAGAFGATNLAEIDSPLRVEHCRLAESLGMMFMVHVADPDTWFKTTYVDARRYGTKAQQYVGLERMLDRFTAPWIAAHMGGWPEDLDFLDGLLSRHPNLYLDTSATKWVVRELSRHPRERVLAFFTRWRTRLLFGSDLVVMDDQLSPAKKLGSKMGDLASTPEQAFELYCSRYWTLRTMFESTYSGQSPIADPDLAMVEPEKYTEMSCPTLQGFAFPPDLLADLYRKNAERLLGRWWREHA